MRMISANKFWTCVFLMYLLTAGYCVYAESNKSASQKQPKYELKSDIINFDYSKMAYPATSSTIGISDSTTVKVPAKRVEPRPLTDEEKFEKLKEEILDGLAMFGLFVLLLVSCICWTVYIPRFIVWLFLLIRRKIIRMWHGEGLFRSKLDSF